MLKKIVELKLWPLPLRWMGLLLCLMIFIAGREANAGKISFAINANEYSIDENITVRMSCERDGWNTRREAYWTLDEVGNPKTLSRGDIDWYDDNWDEWNNFVRHVKDFAKPGTEYQVTGRCISDLSQTSGLAKFYVRPLTGTFEAVLKDNNIEVSGTVGNGANRVTVYRNGVEVASQNAVSSQYLVDFPVLPGKQQKIEVFVHYGSHSQSLGSVLIDGHDAPDVGISSPPEFTRNADITIQGSATSEAGIKSVWYEATKAEGGSVGEDYLNVAPGKDINFKKAYSLGVDGKYRFRFWARGGDGQEAWSPVAYTTLDKKAPDIKILNRPQDDFLNADTELSIEVRDLNRENEDGVGVKSVQVEATDKNGNKSGWKEMSRRSGTDVAGEYAIPLGQLFAFKNIPPGDVRFQFWAKDKAENDAWAPVVVYKKAEPPVASLTSAKAITNAENGSIELDIKADADVKIKNIWLDVSMVDKDGKPADFNLAPVHFTVGKNVDFRHAYTFPQGEGTYSFYIISKAEDGQQNDMSKARPVTVVFDKTPAVVSQPSPAEDSKVKSEFDMKFKVEDKGGSGIADVQLQICRDSNNCSTPWYTNIDNDGKGNYEKKLSVADLPSGPFAVTVWVKDKAENRTWHYIKYTKELNAADAVTTELSFVNGDGSVATDPFYFDETRRLRLLVESKTGSEGIAVAYSLPDGLSLAGKAALKGNSVAVLDANKQVGNWTGSGNLLADFDLGKDELIVIDIPVKMTKELPRTKVGIGGQATSFEVTGKNFTGTARAETTWRADWKKEPADVNAPASKKFDLSKPEDIVLFDKVSGGYDTAKPAKWNRNTLHCRSGNAECKRGGFGSDIKLRFTEQSTQKTVDLNLRGHRDQTLLSGRPTPRIGALDEQANPGAEAGVDAEVRFSVAIPKSELARLPGHGQWRAELIMDMKDAAGTNLAVFSSDITLDVTDENDMSLKPPRIELVEGSHRDNNGSGGFTANDEFVYRVTYVASRDLNNVRLELTLPPGLDRSETPRHVGDSFGGLLSNRHGDNLLQNAVSLKQGQKLVIDVPLRIHPSSAAKLVSQAHAHADGFDPLPSAEAVLNVQKRFDVSESLGMTVELIGLNAEEEPVVAQQAPLKYQQHRSCRYRWRICDLRTERRRLEILVLRQRQGLGRRAVVAADRSAIQASRSSEDSRAQGNRRRLDGIAEAGAAREEQHGSDSHRIRDAAQRPSGRRSLDRSRGSIPHDRHSAQYRLSPALPVAARPRRSAAGAGRQSRRRSCRTARHARFPERRAGLSGIADGQGISGTESGLAADRRGIR